jgi:hypothetical protein
VLLGGGRARAVEPDVLLRETGAPDLHHAFRTVTGNREEAPA